jgi:dihydropteroate synthase
MNTVLRCGKYRLAMDRPLIMGIVNLTPDSFSADGMDGDVDRAIAHARRLVDEGADILDIGAESSRPGAIPTPEDEELRRLIPVVEEISGWAVPVSVDTYKPNVMRASIAAGASMINDISGLRDLDSIDVLSKNDCGICVMHMQGVPGTMQQLARYENVVEEVCAYLGRQAIRCEEAGIDRERVVLDPGFGFGKTLEHNFTLFRALTVMRDMGYPLLVGVSRKSMLGAIVDRPVGERMVASVAAALIAAQKGAKILRVHDVAATRDAMKIMAAIEYGDL